MNNREAGSKTQPVRYPPEKKLLNLLDEYKLVLFLEFVDAFLHRIKGWGRVSKIRELAMMSKDGRAWLIFTLR